jgi:hypothetical protein
VSQEIANAVAVFASAHQLAIAATVVMAAAGLIAAISAVVVGSGDSHYVHINGVRR